MKRTIEKMVIVATIISCFTIVVYAVDWHSMSQTARDQAIIDRGLRDVGKYVGLNCKEWVQKVVSEASSRAVYIPTTMSSPNDYLWNSAPYVGGMCMSIRNIKPGRIVQMKWLSTGGPHTFIVTSVISSGMNIVESNSNWDLKVSARFWTFQDFEAKVGSKFSVFCIL